MKTIKEIKIQIETADIDNREVLLDFYRKDERSGVKKIVEKYHKEKVQLQQEKERLYKLSEYERKYQDYSAICGIDEVGRGPLAGPVVAAAVILPKNCEILYINDSKQVREKLREQLYEQIMEEAISVGVGVVAPGVIDDINILQATFLAMRNAIGQLSVKPDLLLNDAVQIPKVSIKQVPIIKGDAKSVSIGAASIIAKVTRDRMMVEYHNLYPEYDFAHNKGYGSALHIEKLKEIGPCPIHRTSFIGNFQTQ